MLSRMKEKRTKATESNQKPEMAMDQVSINPKFESPKILLLNISSDVCQELQNQNYIVFDGKLGASVKIPNNTPRKGFCCLPNHVFPDDLYEYEMLIVDLCDNGVNSYNPDEHKKDVIKGNKDLYFYCEYPATVFDSRAFSSSMLRDVIERQSNKPSIVIVFADEYEQVEYTIVNNEGNHVKTEYHETHSNYSFIGRSLPDHENLSGNRITLASSVGQYGTILKRHIDGAKYQIVFNHPQLWHPVRMDDPTFIPLLCNGDGGIVGYLKRNNEQTIFMLPNIKDKAKFVIEFMSFLPDQLPKVFPFVEKDGWVNSQNYFLPNHLELVNEMDLLVSAFEKAKNQITDRINSNIEEYKYLHQMLLETGDTLVRALIKYLEWLGFVNVKNCDDLNPSVKEEDIQIETEKGLLIIEVKGIFGTSKDDECAQISKIRFRRMEDRQKFDVFSLYIVNNQRMLPPMDRKNPPFTELQIQDAIREKRGLLTTWQLFNLFFNIRNGILTKEQARAAFWEVGLIDFTKDVFVEIGSISEILKSGLVGIVNLVGIQIVKGDQVYYQTHNQFCSLTIKSIQKDDNPVELCSSGEVGIMFEKAIKSKIKLFKKTS